MVCNIKLIWTVIVDEALGLTLSVQGPLTASVKRP